METKIIRNKKNQIVLGINNEELFYLGNQLDDQEQEENINFFMERSLSLSIKHIEDCVYRLTTILDLQEEYGNIESSQLKVIYQEMKSYSHRWKTIVNRIDNEPFEIMIYSKEGSGRISSWEDKLYLYKEDKVLYLTSCRKDNLTACERIEYYGIEVDGYWDSMLDNGEMILFTSDAINNIYDLIKNITAILTNEEHWSLKENEINWRHVIEVLINNLQTEGIGRELKDVLKNKNFHKNGN